MALDPDYNVVRRTLKVTIVMGIADLNCPNPVISTVKRLFAVNSIILD